MEHRRVIFPLLNLDFESPVYKKPLAIAGNQKCSHSNSNPFAAFYHPVLNDANSAATFSINSQRNSISNYTKDDDQTNDDDEELMILEKIQRPNTRNKNFTRITNKKVLPLEKMSHPPKVGTRNVRKKLVNPSFCIGTKHQSNSASSAIDYPNSSSNNNFDIIDTFPKFVLKTKSEKFKNPQQNATELTEDTRFSANKTLCEPGRKSNCLRLSKVDTNGNDMTLMITPKEVEDKPVPLLRTQTYEKLQDRPPENNTTYIPPSPFVHGRFNRIGYESENSLSDDEEEEQQDDNFPSKASTSPLQLSKVDNLDSNSFQPPSIPAHIQEKLLQTIQSIQKSKGSTKEKELIDHGQGETRTFMKHANTENQDSNDSTSTIHRLSFHYETKDGNLDNLTATGFSVNFHYPNNQIDVVGHNSAIAVSNYFPGKRRSQSQSNIVNTSELPTLPPSFMRLDFGNNQVGEDYNNMGKSNLHPLILGKSHKLKRSLSNLSMRPMVYSEKGSQGRINEFQVRGPFTEKSESVKRNIRKIKYKPPMMMNKMMPNPFLQKPKIPNARSVLVLDMNNNSKVLPTPPPLENNVKTGINDNRFSSYYHDLRQRPYIDKDAIVHQNENVPEKKMANKKANKNKKVKKIVRKRPITRRSTSTKSTARNKTPDIKIVKTTQSLTRTNNFFVQRSKSADSLCNLKSVSSVNFNNNCRSRSSIHLNLNSCSKFDIPRIHTVPNLSISTKSVQELVQLVQQPMMPPSVKNAEPNPEKRRVTTKKLKAQLDQPEGISAQGREGGGEVKPETAIGFKKTPPKIQTKVKKLKNPIVIKDEYYLNSTESEKEIIKELVRADVDAMLERDAVALLTLNEEEQLQNEAPPSPGVPIKEAIEPVPPIKNAPAVHTHWSWRATDPRTNNKSVTPAGNKNTNNNKLFAGAGVGASKNNKSPRTVGAGAGGKATTLNGKSNAKIPSLTKSKRK